MNALEMHEDVRERILDFREDYEDWLDVEVSTKEASELFWFDNLEG